MLVPIKSACDFLY